MSGKPSPQRAQMLLEQGGVAAMEVVQPAFGAHLDGSLIARREHKAQVRPAYPAHIVNPDPGISDLPDHISDPAGVMRLLEFADRRKCGRRSWLDGFMNCSQRVLYSHDSCSFLAQAEASFSILFISSDDLRRLNAIIRDIRAALPSKVIVPVLSHASDEIIVGLLQRGADDVLHCDMDRSEAVGRVHALQRRQKWSEERFRREADERTKLELELRDLTHSPLTPTERMVLVHLTRHKNQTVPYYSLKRHANVGSLNSLKVFICKLRKKLVAGVAVQNKTGVGYTMIDRRCS